MSHHLCACTLLVAAALLTLQPVVVRAAADGRSWRPATNSALEFEIVDGQLTDFDGGTISLRRQHGEHAAWRFGCEVTGLRLRSNIDVETASSYATRRSAENLWLNAQLTRLSFPLPERRLRPWFGFALGGGTGRFRNEWSEATASHSSRIDGPYVYGAALAGLEYSIAPRFAIHAQYGQGAQYTYNREESLLRSGITQSYTSEYFRWQLYSTGARFGLAVFY